MENTIDIMEYRTRSQLRAIAYDANHRERERKRFIGLLQEAREAAEKAAHSGKYEIRLSYAKEDAEIMSSLLRRALIGCSVVIETTTTIHVCWI